MVLRGRRINNFVDFSCSGAVDIWLLTLIFHTSAKGWPPQPSDIFGILFWSGAKVNNFLRFSHLESLFLWDWSLKIQFFYDIWHPLFQRLWRPAFGTCMKHKGQKSKAHCSWTCLQRIINKIIDHSTPQNHLQSQISMWDTL